MGVSLYVYSPSDAVMTSEELRRELYSQGWHVRFVLDQGKPFLEPAAEGPLTALLDLMGWSTSSDKGVLAAEAIDRGDLKAVQSLYDEGVIGTAGYRVESPFVFVEESVDYEGEDEDDQEPIEARFVEAMKQARTRYILQVRARSSNQSYKFLNVVWEAIGRLRDGLLVDPQSGEIRDAG